MTKVSVIIPVYNTEKYLRKCLDSVCNQTLSDIEIICINDCSEDKSLSVLNDYAQNDNRVKIINLEKNQGVSYARNTGIINANGEYVGFVDSDDYIEKNYFETLYNCASLNDSDMAKACMTIIENDKITKYDLIKKEKLSGGEKMLFGSNFTVAIYKNSFLKSNSIHFRVDIPYGEDILFLSEALKYANKISLCENTNYIYVRRLNSADSALLSDEYALTANYVYKLIADNLNTIQSDSPCDEAYIKSYLIYINSLYEKLFRNKNEEIRNKIIDTLFDIYNKCLMKDAVLNKLSIIKIFFANNDFKTFKKLIKNCDTNNQFQMNVLRNNYLKAAK